MTGEHVVVLITTPAGKGEEIANFIVERRLGACVNIIKEIRSFYWWKGNIERDNEELLIIKTKRQILDKLIEEVKKVHPYTVPEIIALPIVAGNIDYLNWIEEEVKQ
ncbi:MAG: divalent-cation tolerance protein CutA [Desulfurococcales archaeon]|nr:divalent-cation tolerance protein CutA [Desulfurococcales archaeon]MCE4622742.1 divalent-cation tolerance protein CutA [Desulfurococcales archaeon]MCE4626201.1 divalent-cation tolerance protein CutA [Desulfurococcales archaeon]